MKPIPFIIFWYFVLLIFTIVFHRIFIQKKKVKSNIFYSVEWIRDGKIGKNDDLFLYLRVLYTPKTCLHNKSTNCRVACQTICLSNGCIIFINKWFQFISVYAYINAKRCENTKEFLIFYEKSHKGLQIFAGCSEIFPFKHSYPFNLLPYSSRQWLWYIQPLSVDMLLGNSLYICKENAWFLDYLLATLRHIEKREKNNTIINYNALKSNKMTCNNMHRHICIKVHDFLYLPTYLAVVTYLFIV